MKTKANKYYKGGYPPRCVGCNEFMSHRQLSRSIIYIPYGGALDLEPPEDEYYHRKCWRKLKPNEKTLVRKISWMLPYDNLTKKNAE